MATVQTRRGHCWGHAAREEEGRMRHARRQPARPKTAVRVWTCKERVVRLLPLKTVWPSGLRRWLKAPFRKGVGSNPTAVNGHYTRTLMWANVRHTRSWQQCVWCGEPIGLRWRNSPICTLSQNGYGANEERPLLEARNKRRRRNNEACMAAAFKAQDGGPALDLHRASWQATSSQDSFGRAV